MADFITRFEADEGVSRANFNSRIDEMNNGFAQLKETADTTKAITDTKGQPNGLATLDANGKLVQKPAAIAASEITSGTLPVARGGTGATTAADALTALGAAAASHTQAASTITAGTFPTTNIKAANGTDYTTARIRNIYANTTAMTAKTTALASGCIYLQYE